MNACKGFVKILPNHAPTPIYLEEENRKLKQLVANLSLDKRAYENQMTLGFSHPGKPTDNAFIESFNGTSGMNA